MQDTSDMASSAEWLCTMRHGAATLGNMAVQVERSGKALGSGALEAGSSLIFNQ